METNSLQMDSSNLPIWQEIEPYIPHWFLDNGCSFPGPKWIWALVFGWKPFYEMSRVCRVHDALYYLGQIEGWEFSWMDKEEMDQVLEDGIIFFGHPKKAKLVAWGLTKKISDKIFDEIGQLTFAMDLSNWDNYVSRKKQQLNITEVTGWE